MSLQDSLQQHELSQSSNDLLSSSTILTSPSSSSSSSASSSSSSSPSSPDAETDPLEQLDSFLRDALNSRNRITVLRLELEVEKFVKNSTRQQLLLNPMPSSYERLAAHRVAQYYHLQSMVVDTNVFPGSRILLLKTSATRFPSVRLADIPVDHMLQEKSSSPLLEKVAIKRRVAGAFNTNGAGVTEWIIPSKSVEERTEEYNKARARIFNDRDPERVSGMPNINGPAVVRKISPSKSVGGRTEEHTNARILNAGDLVTMENSQCSLHVKEEESNSCKMQELLVASGGMKGDQQEDEFIFTVNNKVAILRDKEKDMKDPDYNRSYDRYLLPRIGANFDPSVTQGACVSSGNVNGFVYQAGFGLVQTRADPVCYSTFYPRDPWVGSAGLSVVGYPVVVPENFTQIHHQPLYSHTGLPSQKTAFMGHFDCCQFPSKVETCPGWFKTP